MANRLISISKPVTSNVLGEEEYESYVVWDDERPLDWALEDLHELWLKDNG